ncbi:galactose-1-phosphate uridylyltransferase [Aquipuribacter nitratireducens]|uniref:Galactose-1-phosphate uridylyltransferase n=1 Tax=Aquipuribacter nitratireducens TaxID=650104 RepID=A0ABW0GJY9_9MICO
MTTRPHDHARDPALAGHRVHRSRVLLSDGRELFYFDDTEPWVSGRTRPGDDTRDLPPLGPAARMRRDPLTGEWVPLASHRMNRTHLPPREACPLCPTAPGGTPSEVPAADYDVVVFENRFPSLNPRDPEPAGLVDGEALWPEDAAAGRCEVVCFTADHESTFADLHPARVRTVVEAWADRTAELSRLPAVRSVFCFENRGREIGVTLTHPHGQVYAYPYVPPRSAQHAARAAEHHAATGRDLLGDVLAAERRSTRRVVLTGEHWTAFVPAAARWPVEVHLVPHRHVLDLAGLDDAERDELALLYPRLLRLLDRFFEGEDGSPVTLPYIAGWFAAPVGPERDGDPAALPRLHLQVFSVLRAAGKLKFLAGSESGQGAWVSDTTPERIADRFAELVRTDRADPAPAGGSGA